MLSQKKWYSPFPPVIMLFSSLGMLAQVSYAQSGEMLIPQPMTFGGVRNIKGIVQDDSIMRRLAGAGQYSADTGRYPHEIFLIMGANKTESVIPDPKEKRVFYKNDLNFPAKIMRSESIYPVVSSDNPLPGMTTKKTTEHTSVSFIQPTATLHTAIESSEKTQRIVLTNTQTVERLKETVAILGRGVNQEPKSDDCTEVLPPFIQSAPTQKTGRLTTLPSDDQLTSRLKSTHSTPIPTETRRKVWEDDIAWPTTSFDHQTSPPKPEGQYSHNSGEASPTATMKKVGTSTDGATGNTLSGNGGVQSSGTPLSSSSGIPEATGSPAPNFQSGGKTSASPGLDKKSSEADLLAAAESGDTERVKELLAQGVSPLITNGHRCIWPPSMGTPNW